MDNDLSTEMWVSAHIHQFNAQGIPIYIIKKGASDRGVVVLKLVKSMQECRLLTQMRNMDGELCWVNALESDISTEREADQYIAQEIEFDDDLWVIEVEKQDLENPFDGKKMVL